jgi:hypothetical protein
MKKVELDSIPLFLSALLIIASLIIVSTSDYTFAIKHYLGFIGFLLSVYTYFKSRVLFFIVFSLVLLAGMFGLLDFYYRSFKVGFGNFGINPLFLLLFILLFTFGFFTAKKIDSKK